MTGPGVDRLGSAMPRWQNPGRSRLPFDDRDRLQERRFLRNAGPLSETLEARICRGVVPAASKRGESRVLIGHSCGVAPPPPPPPPKRFTGEGARDHEKTRRRVHQP